MVGEREVGLSLFLTAGMRGRAGLVGTRSYSLN